MKSAALGHHCMQRSLKTNQSLALLIGGVTVVDQSSTIIIHNDEIKENKPIG